MPLYPYMCEICGGFQKWQSMTACDRSVPCPRCGNASQRTVSAPSILGMDTHVREAHKRNEKSAHEPRLVRRNNKQGHHAHAHAGAGTDGSHFHQSSRPWMIGH
jgi:putative FmdB family regulatory protein